MWKPLCMTSAAAAPTDCGCCCSACRVPKVRSVRRVRRGTTKPSHSIYPCVVDILHDFSRDELQLMKIDAIRRPHVEFERTRSAEKKKAQSLPGYVIAYFSLCRATLIIPRHFPRREEPSGLCHLGMMWPTIRGDPCTPPRFPVHAV